MDRIKQGGWGLIKSLGAGDRFYRWVRKIFKCPNLSGPSLTTVTVFISNCGAKCDHFSLFHHHDRGVLIIFFRKLSVPRDGVQIPDKFAAEKIVAILTLVFVLDAIFMIEIELAA